MGDDTMDPNNRLRDVEEIKPEDISAGDVLWAHDDGDWLRVAQVAVDHDLGVVVYRIDGSEATYRHNKTLLRRVS